MSRSRITVFFEEFSFLGDYLHEKSVESVRVQRVDYDLMGRTPEAVDLGFLQSYFVRSKYLLLDESGQKLTQVGVRSVEKKWWNPMTWFGEQENPGETVGDAIARLGDDARKVYFVLCFNPTPPYQVVLYKPPKQFTIRGWLDEEVQRERAAIRTECDQIDALANK